MNTEKKEKEGSSASSSTWRFAQIFGEQNNPNTAEIDPADLVSAVCYSTNGEYLAAGDQGGRVVIFKRSQNNKKTPEYKFYVQFQSHDAEFDYLKSLEISEKINTISWLPQRSPSSQNLLTTNDKTIKLWRFCERQVHRVTGLNCSVGGGMTNGTLKLPSLEFGGVMHVAMPRRVFGDGHAYHINAISPSSDLENFISSDDLRINLWNLEITNEAFQIVDLKPENMDDLTEVITTAQFDPTRCNVFAYASSKGTIKLADMRARALCDHSAKVFEEKEDLDNRSYFSEIISSVSDANFSPDGRYILVRDFLTLKVWDLLKEDKPLRTINIHPHLRTHLCDLYENDSIFDKFECCWSPNSQFVLTGSYNNFFHIYDIKKASDDGQRIRASKFEPKKVYNTKKGGSLASVQLAHSPPPRSLANNHKEAAEEVDHTKKVLQVSWHPSQNLIALGAASNLFIYSST